MGVRGVLEGVMLGWDVSRWVLAVRGRGGEGLRGFSNKSDGEFVGILKNNLLFGHNSTQLPSHEKYITFTFYPVYSLHVAHSPAVRYFPFLCRAPHLCS